MRNILLAALGWVIVALTVADIFRTVLWSGQGGGPITTMITSVLRRLRGRTGARSVIGPLALAVTVLTWTISLLVGFTLTTQMDPEALRSTSTDVPAGWVERVYVVGYSMFTMGNGDFAPTTDAMRLLIVAINGSGMLLVTLSVTYLVPVIGASVASRAFAESVLSLGDSPHDVIVGAWDGRRVTLDDQLRSARSELSVLAQQHLAYPVLHLFDSSDPDVSSPLAVRRLDEVLTLLDAAEPDAVPPAPVRRQLRSSIARYTRTYGTRGHTASEAPPAPDLGPLRAAGIPLRVGTEQFQQMVDELGDHRGWVHSIVDPQGR